MKETNVTVTLAPNDARALREAAEAKYPGSSPKFALRLYCEGLLADIALARQHPSAKSIRIVFLDRL